MLQYHQTPSQHAVPFPSCNSLESPPEVALAILLAEQPPLHNSDDEHLVLCHIFSEGMADFYNMWITSDTEQQESVVLQQLISYPPLTGVKAANRSAETCDVMETNSIN